MSTGTTNALFQLDLFFTYNRESLQDYLTKNTGKPVSLEVTDNSSSMLSVKRKGNKVFVRLHWMFLNAGNDVIREIAEFIISRKGGIPLIRQFIRGNSHFLKKKSVRSVSIRTQGKYHDLHEIFTFLNDKYFKGRITSPVTWGNKLSRRAVKKRTLGSYSRSSSTIIINPFLDTKKVPRYFLEFVVYHEMLHSEMLFEETKKNGRRPIHSSEFKKRERLFEQYDKAVSWEKRQ
jgi:hypothetical protein